MNELENIRPTTKPLVMDLVQAAGIDVGDWQNVSGGKSPASNPKYCYEWSFLEPKKLMVINLRFDEMIEHKGVISRHMNARSLVEVSKGARKRRSLDLDEHLKVAAKENLEVRVIVVDGKRRNLTPENSGTEVVKLRKLDPVAWNVSYDNHTGEAILTRRDESSFYADQFVHLSETVTAQTKVEKTFSRSNKVRRKVLERADGFCEFCKQRGFKTADGRLYLETHHIVPLSENGNDSTNNVIALCPNDHKEAHHSFEKKKLREKLLSIVVDKSRKKRTDSA